VQLGQHERRLQGFKRGARFRCGVDTAPSAERPYQRCLGVNRDTHFRHALLCTREHIIGGRHIEAPEQRSLPRSSAQAAIKPRSGHQVHAACSNVS
jgi:hypothetical protein